MKKGNTTLWYTVKVINFDVFKIMKAHIVDDDCNEYIATIKGDWLRRDYYKPEELNIIDLEPYNRKTWYDMEDEIEYAKAKRIV